MTKKTPGSTPYEKATGHKPDLVAIQRLGAEVMFKIKTNSKLDKKLRKGCWLRFDDKSTGHIIWHKQDNKISIEQDIIFTSADVWCLESLKGEMDWDSELFEPQTVTPSLKPTSTMASKPTTTKTPEEKELDKEDSPQSPEPTKAKSVDYDVKSEYTEPPEANEGHGRCNHKPLVWICDIWEGRGDPGG